MVAFSHEYTKCLKIHAKSGMRQGENDLGNKYNPDGTRECGCVSETPLVNHEICVSLISLLRVNHHVLIFLLCHEPWDRLLMSAVRNLNPYQPFRTFDSAQYIDL